MLSSSSGLRFDLSDYPIRTIRLTPDARRLSYRYRAWRRIGDADLDLVVDDADLVRISFDLRVRSIQPRSAADIEPPAVPWAGDRVFVHCP